MRMKTLAEGGMTRRSSSSGARAGRHQQFHHELPPPAALGEQLLFCSAYFFVSLTAGLVDEEESIDMEWDDPELALLEEEKDVAPAAALPPPRPCRLRRAELRFRRFLLFVLGPLPALGQEEGVSIPGAAE